MTSRDFRPSSLVILPGRWAPNAQLQGWKRKPPSAFEPAPVPNLFKVHGAGASESQATSVNAFGLHPRLIFDLDVLLTLDLNGRGPIQLFVL